MSWTRWTPPDALGPGWTPARPKRTRDGPRPATSRALFMMAVNGLLSGAEPLWIQQDGANEAEMPYDAGGAGAGPDKARANRRGPLRPAQLASARSRLGGRSLTQLAQASDLL